jgi:DNA-nicking Smr family endonuclease
MLIAKGNKVKFKYSGEAGVVVSILDKDIALVRVDSDGLEIPVFINDLLREDALDVMVYSEPVREEENMPETQYYIVQGKGLQAGFRPMGESMYYLIYLINDLQKDYVFTLKFWLNETLYLTKNGKIEGNQVIEVGTLDFEKLNDQPKIELEAWEIKDNGSGAKEEFHLKLKGKSFFKPMKTMPLLPHNGFVFLLEKKKKVQSESLFIYTKENILPGKKKEKKNALLEKAEFEIELDLHLPGAQGKVLDRQLAMMEQYISKAFLLGIDKIFVIHGIGEGVLKNVIHDRLKRDYRIGTYKNEYHPKYGWGATEITLVSR